MEGTDSRIQEIKCRSKCYRNINYLIHLEAADLSLSAYY